MEYLPESRTPILVVDDDVGLLLSVKATLASAGMPEPALVSDSRRVMDLLRKHSFRLVLLDLIMPHLSGMELLRELKEEFPDIECVIITAIDEVSFAIEAMRFGAFDYLVKPLDSERLIIALNNALERHHLRQGLALLERSQSFADLKHPEAFKEMVVEDEAMARVFHQAETAGASDYNLLITGETGTGKEMLARIIHGLSHRSRGPFVGVNMASFSRSLFEDDFFGHAKGAYTGAFSEKKGFFEAAQGGTLFLDEIAELERDLQPKLLRVIQERELYRLGSTKVGKLDLRLITSSNRDIKKEVRQGHFRDDLFYRLNTFHIHIPPLRERKRDILPLARHFLRIHARQNNKQINVLAPDLADGLLQYPFPGNVRELENIIAAAVLAEKGKVLTLSSVQDLHPASEPDPSRTEEPLSLAEVEKRHILRVLQAAGGNRTRAAKLLGIGLRTLQRKLKAYGEPNAAPR